MKYAMRINGGIVAFLSKQDILKTIGTDILAEFSGLVLDGVWVREATKEETHEIFAAIVFAVVFSDS